MALSIAELVGTVELEDKFTPGLDKLTGSMVSAGAVIGVAIAAVTGLTVAIVKLGERGAEIEDVARNFEGLSMRVNETADAMLGALRKGTAGVVSDFELMKMSNKAMGAGFQGSAKDMETLAAGARELANRVGLEGGTAAAFDLLTSSMAKGKAQGLAQLGLMVDQKAALENYAASIGKSASELSGLEKKQATQKAVLEALAGTLKDAGTQSLDFSEKIGRVVTFVQNFVDKLALAISKSPVLNAALDSMAKAFETAFGDDQSAAISFIVGLVEDFAIIMVKVAEATVTGVKFISDAWMLFDVAFNLIMTGVFAISAKFITTLESMLQASLKLAQSVLAIAQAGQAIPGIGGAMTVAAAGLSVAIGGIKSDLGSIKGMGADLEGMADGFAKNVDKAFADSDKRAEGLDNLSKGLKGFREGMEAAKGTAEKATAPTKAFAAAVDTLGETTAQTAEKQKKLLEVMNRLGPSTMSIEKDFDDLIESFNALGGDLTKLTDKQLVTFIQKLQVMAESGSATEPVFMSLAAAMDEMGGRSDFAAKQVGLLGSEMKKTETKTKAVADQTLTLGMAFDTVADIVGALGFSTDSFLGSLANGLKQAIGLAGNLGKTFAVMENGVQVGTKGFGALSMGDKLGVGTQVLGAGIDIFKGGQQQGAVKGALGGAMKGAMIGSAIPGVGTLLGAGAGALLGGIGGLFGGGEGKKVKEGRNQFIEEQGGLEQLQRRAEAANVSLTALFDAKKTAQLKQAITDINSQLSTSEGAHAALADAVERYGFTVEELGPKWQAQQLDSMAGSLLQDYQLLIASGIENETVINRMGPAFNEYVQTVLASGAAIPEAMRPILEDMVEMGTLTDAAGNKIESLEGIKFAESMSDQLSKIVEGIQQMVAALTGIPNVERTVTVRTVHDDGGANGNMKVPGMATGGLVTRPTLAVVGEAGPEAVIPLDKLHEMQGSGGGGITRADMQSMMTAQRRQLTLAIRDALIQSR